MAKKNKETWTTQDGITLYLTEMEDTHLFNALMFLARQRERALQMEMPRIASGFARKMEAFLEECYRRELFVDIDEIEGTHHRLKSGAKKLGSGAASIVRDGDNWWET